MSHDVRYYLPRANIPGVGLVEIAAALDQLGRIAVDRSEGETWAAATFTSPTGAYTAVELHSDPVMWREGLTEAGAPDPSSVRGLVIITLSGPGTDNDAINTLRRLFIDKWHGIEYDEIGGFNSG